MRIRRPRGERKATCSKCGGERETSRGNQRYCKSCHADNMRLVRLKHKIEFLRLKALYDTNSKE